jgi:pilus assembly protein CpaF
MRPDVIIVGEVRGHEVIVMLNAMSSGNAAGSMCTVHGQSPQAAIQRLVSLCSQAPERLGGEASAQLIATAVNLIVHLDKVSDGHGGLRRVVSAILEVDGVTEEGRGVATNPVFAPGPDGLAVPHSAFSDETKRRLTAAGFDLGRLFRLEGGW